MAGDTHIIVIGAGLAGCEAAWAAANHSCHVTLYEMRPSTPTPAHRTSDCAELVCSNSFRSNQAEHAIGTLKVEMRALGSLTMAVAAETAVPAGKGLAVDRDLFSARMTERIHAHPHITVCHEEVTSLANLREREPTTPIVVATGPLTADQLAQDIQRTTQSDDLYFYDSMAPLIAADSIDASQTFWASRYGAGEGDDYLNCPMTRAQYQTFVMALIRAEKVPPRNFEDPKYFEGCLPIEVMAERGLETLRHGPMKPFGLRDPKTQRSPDAMVQLRKDNRAGTILNMVGFQTRMTWPEQKRIFQTIPGLAQAEFLRMGAMHRNTYINAPRLLDRQLQLRDHPGMYFAGQIAGVEGYVESAAMGIYVGHILAGQITGPPPMTTAMGSLIEHVTHGNPDKFEPMNANWGLTPPLPEGVRYRERKAAYSRRAEADFAAWKGAALSPDNCVAMVGGSG
jgi:methylenetetrahydrofolate--tRNA-(uracil-5-)-methyltransferase